MSDTKFDLYVVHSVESVGKGFYRIRMKYSGSSRFDPDPSNPKPSALFVNVPDFVIRAISIKRLIGATFDARDVLRPEGMVINRLIELNNSGFWQGIFKRLGGSEFADVTSIDETEETDE